SLSINLQRPIVPGHSHWRLHATTDVASIDRRSSLPPYPEISQESRRPHRTAHPQIHRPPPPPRRLTTLFKQWRGCHAQVCLGMLFHTLLNFSPPPKILRSKQMNSLSAPLAQLDRASAYGAEG